MLSVAMDSFGARCERSRVHTYCTSADKSNSFVRCTNVSTMDIVVIISLRVAHSFAAASASASLACIPKPCCKNDISINIYFCVYFAFCSLFYSHSTHCVCCTFSFIFLFGAGSVFLRAIQLKCTRDICTVAFFSRFIFVFHSFRLALHQPCYRRCRLSDTVSVSIGPSECGISIEHKKPNGNPREIPLER